VPAEGSKSSRVGIHLERKRSQMSNDNGINEINNTDGYAQLVTQ
jgi:hypothetical protein